MAVLTLFRPQLVQLWDRRPTTGRPSRRREALRFAQGELRGATPVWKMQNAGGTPRERGPAKMKGPHRNPYVFDSPHHPATSPPFVFERPVWHIRGSLLH